MHVKIFSFLSLRTMHWTSWVIWSLWRDCKDPFRVLVWNQWKTEQKPTLEATRNYVPYIHHSKYFIFENLYSLHFHSIITRDEKQKIASSMQIINTAFPTNQILTFQCYFPIYAGNCLQSWNWLENSL